VAEDLPAALRVVGPRVAVRAEGRRTSRCSVGSLGAGVDQDSVHEQPSVLDEILSGGFLVVVEGEDRIQQSGQQRGHVGGGFQQCRVTARQRHRRLEMRHAIVSAFHPAG
jgi:hypothetical protein